jgi:hypothetical protein
MKITLSILAALAFVSPLVGHAQSLSSDTLVIDSSPTSSILTEGNRVGISRVHPKRREMPIIPPGADTARTGGSRAYHTLMGVVVGTLGGAATGAAVGAIVDANTSDVDYMIPGYVVGGVLGTVAGFVVGLAVGLLWPTT